MSTPWTSLRADGQVPFAQRLQASGGHKGFHLLQTSEELDAPVKTGKEKRMKESHGKGPAGHSGPESCDGDRKVAAEALTGENADQVLSCEIKQSGEPTPLTHAEGNTGEGANGESSTGPAQSETLCMRGHSLHGNREIPPTPAEVGTTGRLEKAISRTSSAHVDGKSDIAPKPNGS